MDTVLPRQQGRPPVIHEAMRYTALSGGKRLRPALVILAYESAGRTDRKADPVAAALEMVHAFSLIHDDLPCMDDDDIRRGQPSNHIKYGEGVAVLAGDALLTRAFRVVAARRDGRALGPAVAARLVEELAAATGSQGVIGGQVLDLLAEGRKLPKAGVEFIHRHKTAVLFAAALRLGAIAGDASPALLRRLTDFGDAVGVAFQIVDDILGEAGSAGILGRDPGGDRARGKATYPGVVGMAASHRAVDRLLRKAGEACSRVPGRAEVYRGFLAAVDRRRRDAQGGLLGDRS